jgi:hypothetical protein
MRLSFLRSEDKKLKEQREVDKVTDKLALALLDLKQELARIKEDTRKVVNGRNNDGST